VTPLLLILVDGLRHVDHPTRQRLMPELGFRDVEASLFTGTPVSVHQRLTDYVFADHSPFTPLCRLPGLSPVWRHLAPARRRYLNFLVHRGSEIVRGCTLPRASLIPPSQMAHVAPVAQGSADDPGAFGSCESLFDVLRRSGKTWLYAAPPKVSRWGATDSRVESRVLASLSTGVRDLYFVKLGDLDRISHRFGPSSPQAASCRRVIARRINTLLGALEERAGPLRWILLSDHGFLEVSRHVQPPSCLSTLCDQGTIRYFVDSTIIRIRRMTTQGIPVELTSSLEGTVPLTEETRASLGLDWGSPQLGDCAYLAAPGAVFWPDFFSASPPAGMHGYLPHPACACPLEMHGIPRAPSISTHAELGAWLKLLVQED